MPTPQREPLRRLSRAERMAREHIVRRSSERVDVVRRATALLAVARSGVFIEAELPDVPTVSTELPLAAQWATWLGPVPHLPLPPLRLILIRDNLAGHLSTSIVTWLFAHGVMPLYTPLSGSGLNMAESVQRIICGRALRGQHPKTVTELITWLEDSVAGWNATPTPFVWDGNRRERRLRAKQRHLGGSAARPQHQSIGA